MGLFSKNPTATKKAARGYIHAVPCPHCGKPDDLRGLRPSGEAGWGAYALEEGTVLGCKHCNGKMVIKNVQDVTIVTVAQYNR